MLTIASIADDLRAAGCTADLAGLGSLQFSSITADSRAVQPGAIFCAVRGAAVDGRSFVSQAVERGAAVIVSEGALSGASGAPVLVVEDARLLLSLTAARLFGHPTKELLTVGVTGTNGKTSVSWIMACALAALGSPAALCGTLGKTLLTTDGLTLDRAQKTLNTTPDGLELQSFFAQSRRDGAGAAVLEVTSQGLVQRRTKGIHWDAGIFTNLTRDHLDLHGTIENYAAIKKAFLLEDLAESDKQSIAAIINSDDAVGRAIISQLAGGSRIRCCSYSLHDRAADAFVTGREATLQGSRLEATIFGTTVDIGSRLIGHYNAANLLASALCLAALGYGPEQLKEALRGVPRVPGRLELVAECDVHVFVDYAHTPDALINALSSLRELSGKRILTVFGCGGDRDRGKRPLMGAAVAERSDYVVLTSDNPRTEDPERIIDDIVPGVETAAAGGRWTRIADRKAAIEHAVLQAEPGDAVLVAGKGHEDYQEINGVRHPFLDRDVCLEVMRRNGIL